MEKETLVKIVKPLAKGQITIPVKFRESLGIDENTHLKLTLKEERFFGEPIRIKSESRGVGPVGKAARLAAVKRIASLNFPVESWDEMRKVISEAHQPCL